MAHDPSQPEPPPDRREAGEREIFLAALDIQSGVEREAFLEKACGGDDALRKSVGELLGYHRDDDFMEESGTGPSLAEQARKLAVNWEDMEREIRKSLERDGYRIRETIGEGGCGTVYLATQEHPVRRRVAVKVIKPGMDSRSVIARFEGERQALAMMDHPCIATVLGAGTTLAGRPYFVMELVRGVSIVEFCRRNSTSVNDRIRLFCEVCRAIQHAHQKGIIHRDIKPSNVLITMVDGRPVPKVIDFGIAKAMNQNLDEATMLTGFHAFVGTPAYTSPEQAEMSGVDIDTRSDIYSLGVLLYELLAGTPPFDPGKLKESGLDEMRRIIREEQPAAPSQRLRKITQGNGSGNTGTAAGFSQDLDWIVLKCLEKDRNRRYRTVNELVMDLERHLSLQPVLARPQSQFYRMQLFWKRNRIAVSAATAVVLTLLFTAGISSWMAYRAIHAEEQQANLRQIAEAATLQQSRLRQQAEQERMEAMKRAYNSEMNLVQQAMAAGNTGRATRILDHYGELFSRTPGDGQQSWTGDFRSWEWYYFSHQVEGAQIAELEKQPHRISQTVLSPGNRILATVDDGGRLKFWNMETRSRHAENLMVENVNGPVVFSEDGSLLAVPLRNADRQTGLAVISIAGGEVIASRNLEPDALALHFTSDDRRLRMVDFRGTIRTWTWDSESESESESESQAGVDSMLRLLPDRTSMGNVSREIIFSPKGDRVAFHLNREIHVHDTATGLQTHRLQGFRRSAACLVFSPDSDMLAASPSFLESDMRILLHSLDDGEPVTYLAGHTSWIPDMEFTPDGKRLISASADQSIRIWELEKMVEETVLRGHLSEVNSLAVSSDGRTIVSGGKDGSVYLWDPERKSNPPPFRTLPEPVRDFAILPDESSMLVVQDSGTVRVVELKTLKATDELAAPEGRVVQVTITPDGAHVFLATSRNRVHVIDWSTRLPVATLESKNGDPAPWAAPRIIGPADNGEAILLLHPGSGTVERWNRKTWLLEESVSYSGTGSWRSSVALSHDGSRLAITAQGGTEIMLIEQDTGNSSVLSGNDQWSINALAFSPDGKHLAAASVKGTVQLWQTEEPFMETELWGHIAGVHGVAFSPDGRRLASTSAGQNAIKLWDAGTWQQILSLNGQGFHFREIRFSPQGTYLMTRNSEGILHLWEAPKNADRSLP